MVETAISSGAKVLAAGPCLPKSRISVARLGVSRRQPDKKTRAIESAPKKKIFFMPTSWKRTRAPGGLLLQKLLFFPWFLLFTLNLSSPEP
jgi:hypothetical protein